MAEEKEQKNNINKVVALSKKFLLFYKILILGDVVNSNEIVIRSLFYLSWKRTEHLVFFMGNRNEFLRKLNKRRRKIFFFYKSDELFGLKK